jgi:heme exporter protein CcmD
MPNWLLMGENALYIWVAYGLTLGILVLNVIWSKIRRRTILKQVRSFIARNKNESAS